MDLTPAAIIFDKDGTLFDFAASWAAWTESVLRDIAPGNPAQAAALGRRIGYDLNARRFSPDSPVIAGTAAEIAACLAPGLDHPHLPSLIARMNLLAAQAPVVEAVPLAPLLGALRARGLRLAVVTNDSEAPARAHLRAVGVEGLFDAILGADSGHGAKPEAGPLLAAARQMGVAPARAVMVGDSLHDLAAGRAAAMRTVGVLTGLALAADLAPLADAVLPDIGALPAWLDRISAKNP